MERISTITMCSDSIFPICAIEKWCKKSVFCVTWVNQRYPSSLSFIIHIEILSFYALWIPWPVFWQEWLYFQFSDTWPKFKTSWWLKWSNLVSNIFFSCFILVMTATVERLLIFCANELRFLECIYFLLLMPSVLLKDIPSPEGVAFI